MLTIIHRQIPKYVFLLSFIKYVSSWSNIFVTNYYYHVYNKSLDDLQPFKDEVTGFSSTFEHKKRRENPVFFSVLPLIDAFRNRKIEFGINLIELKNYLTKFNNYIKESFVAS